LPHHKCLPTSAPAPAGLSRYIQNCATLNPAS
jgi:hypothetical protein